MKMRAFVKSDSGQVMIITVLCTTVLIGFMALAIDVGLLFRAKRNLQMVADAAATAGALELSYGFSATTAATKVATANGVTAGGGTTVTVNTPPSYGSHTGSGFVEVILQQPNPTFFMGLLTHSSSAMIGARAVAGTVPPTGCGWLNNTKGTDLSLQGNATIQNPDGGTTCGIYSNSSDPDSVSVKGQGNYINTAYVATRGGLSAAGNSNTTPTPVTTYTTYNPPAKLAQVPTANPYTTCSNPTGGTKKVSGHTYYLMPADATPGCYSGDVYLGGGVTLEPGTYAFTGSTILLGNDLTAKSVTLDIISGAFNVNSTTNVTLTAPTDDLNPYQGVVLEAPPTNTSDWNIQWGAAQGVFQGLIVASGINLTLQDQGGSALVTGFYIGSLTLGTGTLEIDSYAKKFPGGSPLDSIALVE
ncbi:MAG TPA: pilus assembly protein TadG-related protein [Terracidiphilus sp.]|nr:pilus assembly protein TadG-related protein [Terracidiphilus sp.]